MANAKVKQAMTGERNTFYMPEVHIGKSFDGLMEIANKLGANIEKGDIIIVDNAKGDKRKAMCQVDILGQRTTIQVYSRLEDNQEYLPMRNGAGKVQGRMKLLEFI